jgi:MoaA/NifB/PqqE/SkfB family radical SAM enzyme
MLNNKSFCIKPWVHACIRTNGNITLCCQSSEIPQHNLKTSSIDEWWTSNFLSEIRTKILNGEEVSSCVACYEIEKNGSVSLRQKSNQEYKIFEQYAKKTLDYYKYPHEQPIELELQLTNLCNLKCLMCKEEDSSSFAVENKKLKISVIDQNDYKVDEVEIKQIKEWIKTSPKLINVRGGEPFIVPEIKELLKWAIDHKLLENTEVHITTNGTSLDNEWETIVRSLPKLRIMVSIDAKGKLNDYIRYGSNWDIIVTNLQILGSIPYIKLSIHATVQ